MASNTIANDDTIDKDTEIVAEARDLGLDINSVPDFYDQNADDKNQKHLNKLRQGRKSDAILSCPCCFTTICVDCQQHALYEDQFRAMFVMNCRVDKNQIVKPDDNQGENDSNDDDDEWNEYNPVHCSSCGIEVGLRETCSDGAYIFFNVIASNA